MGVKELTLRSDFLFLFQHSFQIYVSNKKMFQLLFNFPYLNFNCAQRLREEQAARLTFEKSMREEMDRRWQSLKAYFDEEVHTVRESGKV